MQDYIYMLLSIGAASFLLYLWIGKEKKELPQNTSTKAAEQASLTLRMQAYERLALFLERSKPQSLVMRLLVTTQDAEQLQILLLNTLREEFEHNFSQQIYMSEALWQNISLAKDQLIQLINKVAAEQKQHTAKALSEELVLQYANETDDFIGAALQMLRKEARMVQNR